MESVTRALAGINPGVAEVAGVIGVAGTGGDGVAEAVGLGSPPVLNLRGIGMIAESRTRRIVRRGMLSPPGVCCRRCGVTRVMHAQAVVQPSRLVPQS